MQMEVKGRRTVTPQMAANIYGLDVGSLANDRCRKRGPRYFRCGRRVFYKIEDLEAWLFRNPVLTIDSINLTTIGSKPMGSTAASNEFDGIAAALWNILYCSALRAIADHCFAWKARGFNHPRQGH